MKGGSPGAHPRRLCSCACDELDVGTFDGEDDGAVVARDGCVGGTVRRLVEVQRCEPNLDNHVPQGDVSE